VTGASTLDDVPLTVEHLARQRIAPDLPEPKYRAPHPRMELVRRTALLSRLERARAVPLVLVIAPAGYGKTSLISQWTEQRGAPVAWVTLEEVDGQPEILAASIARALMLIAIQPGLRRRFVLVLDDAHVVPPAVLKQAVLGILGWLPEGSQLAVASRCEPDLALGRMRAQRMLVEVHSEDLAMSPVEASSLLLKTGLDLDFRTVQTLVRRTEGWPAALALAAMSCSQLPAQTDNPAPISGDDHLLSEYFRAELLAPLAPSTITFLTRSSVLDRLSGPLCDNVLDRKRSATLLAELARANVPLAPVDRSHEWYRVHGLLREMLQCELRRTEPELQAALHRRAADWHGRAGDVDRAIDHGRSAGDLTRTGEMLWANLHRYLGEGRNRMVKRWLSGIAAEHAAGCAALSLVAAHSNLAEGRVAVAEQWARSADASLSAQPEASTKPERACVLIVEAWAARAGARGMGEDAARAFALLPADSPWLASCGFLRGTAALLTGDEATAQRHLEEGAARGAVVAPDAASLCLAQLAVVAAERDEPELASDFARRARAGVQAYGLTTNATSALVFAVCAAADLRESRVDDAKAAASQCLVLLALLDDSLSWFGGEVRILVARVLLALGDVAGARELLADASRLSRRTPDVVLFQRWFDAAWDEFDARAETALAGVATLTMAELRVLRFLPTHYSFHEIAQRLHVSPNTVKTHVHAVYRKLDSSSRSEAVAHATEAGLLGGRER
jgi:LuxR family maltose regulon positive regulatory protein